MRRRGLTSKYKQVVTVKNKKGILDFVRKHLQKPHISGKQIFAQMMPRLTGNDRKREKYGQAEKRLMNLSTPQCQTWWSQCFGRGLCGCHLNKVFIVY